MLLTQPVGRVSECVTRHCKHNSMSERGGLRLRLIHPTSSNPPYELETGSRSLDEALGPPLCRIFERSAVGPLPTNPPGPPSVGVYVRRVPALLGWWVRGLNRPTPFFEDRTTAPRAVPRELTPSELTPSERAAL